MLKSLVMHHIPIDQVYTILMRCQILGNQVYATREVDIWRRALIESDFSWHSWQIQTVCGWVRPESLSLCPLSIIQGTDTWVKVVRDLSTDVLSHLHL